MIGRTWLRTIIGVALCVCACGGTWARQDTCSECHSYMNRKSQDVVAKWKQSVHAKNGVGCSDCHGGNPKNSTFNGAMWSVPGFNPRPKKQDIPALCAKCHSDPNYMRPFNISSTSQYAEYKQSVHGKRLLEAGDVKVAVCTDCHGTHDIHAKDDVRSQVYKPNIPKTCAKCHADKEYMKPYGLPTNQYDEYKLSYHAQKLLKEGDKSAPACSDCHGTHGATPPKVTEVPSVCGTCHARTLEYFNAGPHAAALQRGGAPKCVDCHGNHAITKPADDMLVGAAKGHCGSCHAENSAAYRTALAMHRDIVKLREAHGRAISAMERAEAANMDMQDQVAELEDAKTKLVSARAVQHTVTPEKVRKVVEEASDTIASVDKAARQAILKSHRRDKALLVTGILILLTCGALYYRWRLAYRRWREEAASD